MSLANLKLADRHRHRAINGVGHIRHQLVGRVGALLQRQRSHLRLRASIAAYPAEMAPKSDVGVGLPPAGCIEEAMPAGNITGAAQHTPLQPHNASTPPVQSRATSSALKQCLLLGAAALFAAPLILLLDIAERASLGLTQLKQIMQHITSAAGRTSKQQQDSKGIQSVDSQPASAGSNSNNSTSQGSKSSRRRSPRGSHRQQPADLWLLDLYPPFAAMILAVLPPLLLAARHSLIGSPVILQPGLWCFASLMIQGYLNLLLAVRQRVQPRATTAAGVTQAAAKAALGTGDGNIGTTGSAGVVSLVATPQWWQPALAAPSPAAPHHLDLQAASSSSPADIASNAAAGHHQRQQDVSDKSSAASAGTAAVSSISHRMFRVVQVCGDAFRCGCICSIAFMLYQQQAPVASTWAKPLISMLHNSAGGSSALIAAASASALSLQQNVGSVLWLLCDTLLCGGALTVYLLALTARLLPFVDGMLQS